MGTFFRDRTLDRFVVFRSFFPTPISIFLQYKVNMWYSPLGNANKQDLTSRQQDPSALDHLTVGPIIIVLSTSDYTYVSFLQQCS